VPQQKIEHPRDIGVVVNGDMAIVYKITNTINNKPYIGWTSKTLSERLYQKN
jgi:hypothetical protein